MITPALRGHPRSKHTLLGARYLHLTLDVCPHGVSFPLRQTGQAGSHLLLDRPAPGLEEWSQILLHLLRELPHPQVHLANVVTGDVREGLILSKELGERLPPKGLLELEREEGAE